MTFSTDTTRRFSESVLQVYAASHEEAVRAALTVAAAELKAEPWLLELVREHGEQRRHQLRRQASESPAVAANLTPREREVLERIALGETDAAIGRALAIAPKTASKHVENILRKLGVETRTAAAGAIHAQPPAG